MKIVVFDLDETLGYFTEFGIFWDCLINYSKVKNNSSLTQSDFDNILDLYPEFLRPNIINILNYLKSKKQSLCCHKMMIYTNNNGPKEWAHHIIDYFSKKINYKLFDQLISAFKINGKVVEVCRTTHDKTKIINNDDNFTKIMNEHIKLYKYDCIDKESKEYEVDKVVGKQIIKHLQEFFNKSKKNKTVRNKKSKNYKLNKTQRKY